MLTLGHVVFGGLGQGLLQLNLQKQQYPAHNPPLTCVALGASVSNTSIGNGVRMHDWRLWAWVTSFKATIGITTPTPQSSIAFCFLAQ